MKNIEADNQSGSKRKATLQIQGFSTDTSGLDNHPRHGGVSESE
jgi:hypothetical protein